MENQINDDIRAIIWQNESLSLLDQRLLPAEHVYLKLGCVKDVAQAITDMVVRGAPAIGITAAFGVVIAARQRFAESPSSWKQAIKLDIQLLADSRPTAVNLFWALEHMHKIINELEGDPFESLLSAARKIHADDIEANQTMGQFGAGLITAPCAVLTHCNTGSLATGGFGTALGVIRQAYHSGKIKQVFADETRPWMQGSRLTAWELSHDKIPVSLIVEGAAGHLLKQGQVGWIIVGADRVASNGDAANKIGTYNLAVLAREHNVKFMVVAPTSTIDMAIKSGAEIAIENRAESEILSTIYPENTVPEGINAWNPAFDVTPHQLIDALVTEKGVIENPDSKKLLTMMQSSK